MQEREREKERAAQMIREWLGKKKCIRGRQLRVRHRNPIPVTVSVTSHAIHTHKHTHTQSCV